jgi:MFS transporter, MHS family, citrate/tricarballylate:H+ symporter
MADIAPPLEAVALEMVSRPPIPRRYLLAAVAGNAFEFYDFITFTYFATQIGLSFFPSHDPIVSLMASLATFGVGFVTRPLGGILIGIYADRKGRSPAMILSFALMGIGVLVMSLTPSFAAIGLAAPLLVILARLLQGFALGGQVGPSTAYLMEASSPRSRGFFTNLQYASQGVAAMCGGIVGFLLAHVLDSSSLQHWGWRVAIGVGALVLPFGILIRKSMPETLEIAPVVAANAAVPAEKNGLVRIYALALAMLASATIATYVINYMPTYSSTFLHMRADVSLAAPVVSGACIIVFSFVGGWMSDLFGRKVVMVWPRALLLLAILPGFAILARARDATTLLAVTAVLAILNSWSSAASLVNIAETMPGKMRSGALGTVYALAIMAFGGTTQFAVTWLIRATGNVLAPAWYLTAATLVGLIAMILTEESAPIRLSKR